MQCLVSSELTVSGPATNLRLPAPPSLHNWYRDIAVYAFPAAPVMPPAEITADFPLPPSLSLTEAVPGQMLPLPIKEPGGKGTITYHLSQPYLPKFVEITFVERTSYSNLLVEGSDDGANWRTLATKNYRLFRDGGSPKLVELPLEKPATWFRFTFSHETVPVFIRPQDYQISRLRLLATPMIPDVDECNSAKNSFAGRRTWAV